MFCVASIACGLSADAFRANFLGQCQAAGITDLMDSVIENAYESHKRVWHASAVAQPMEAQRAWAPSEMTLKFDS